VKTAIICAILTSLLGFFAWLTHVIVCIKTASWGFLIAGAIAFPIGVIHGFMIWLGAL
jgi:ABC-type nitrate/sulfonate/bicarbonate transport system permease component